MRVSALLMLSILSACAATPGGGRTSLQHEFMMGVDYAPALAAMGLEVPGYPDDAITLIDSRVIRALRKDSKDLHALGLTHGQKVVLWVGVGVVAAYLISEWVEDNLAFLPAE